jgi:hypothetical protein
MTAIALDYARFRRRRWPIVLAILLSLAGTAAVAGVKGPEWRERYAVWVAERQAIADGRAAAEADWEKGSPGFMEGGGFWGCGGVISAGDVTLSYDEKTGLPSRTRRSATRAYFGSSSSDHVYADAYNERVAELFEEHGPSANYIKDPGRFRRSVADLVKAAEWAPVAPDDVPKFLYVDDGDTVSTAPVPDDPRLCMHRVSTIVEARGGLLVHDHYIHVKATGDHVVTLH